MKKIAASHPLSTVVVGVGVVAVGMNIVLLTHDRPWMKALGTLMCVTGGWASISVLRSPRVVLACKVAAGRGVTGIAASSAIGLAVLLSFTVNLVVAPLVLFSEVGTPAIKVGYMVFSFLALTLLGYVLLRRRGYPDGP